MSLKNTGITHPVVIDVTSGEIRPAKWKQGTTDTLEMLPVQDSVIAIADEDYFDWPVLPEAPSGLKALVGNGSVRLTWDVHGGEPANIVLERKVLHAETGRWQEIITLPAARREYSDSAVQKTQDVAYRVRAINSSGSSAYSNIVRIPSH
jgi:hypothetical protein